MSSPKSVLVLGADGDVGTLFSGAMCGDGWSVLGVGLSDRHKQPTLFSRYLCCDLNAPTRACQEMFLEAEVIIFCLPDAVGVEVASGLQSYLPSQCLFVDTLSVKRPVAAVYQSWPKGIEVLSINPLFSPDLGFANQRLAMVPIRTGHRAEHFMGWLAMQGVDVVELTADEHDASTAVVQAATHAALIAFGASLAQSPIAAERLLQVATPVHRTLLMLSSRVLSKNPQVYWSIQVENPRAEQARAALDEAACQLNDAIKGHDESAFRALFSRGRQALASVATSLAGYSQQCLTDQPGDECSAVSRSDDTAGVTPIGYVDPARNRAGSTVGGADARFDPRE